MAVINLKVIIREAGQKDDGLSKMLEIAPDSLISTRLQKALESEREDELVEYTNQARLVLQRVLSSQANDVEELRRIRRREKQIIAKMEKVDMAKKYGLEVHNLAVMLFAIGDIGPLEDNLHLVPEGWKPQEATAAAKTKK